MIAGQSQPPYYAVIFTSERTDGDNGYQEMAELMVRLASEQDGFLGIEGSRRSRNYGFLLERPCVDSEMA